MAPRGWHGRYGEILAEFGYSRRADAAAARSLGAILRGRSAMGRLSRLVGSRDVLVLGSGPSIGAGVRAMARHARATRVAADGAVAELVRRRMRVDVVVTDLDGDARALRAAARSGAVMVVHAHGDNAGSLAMAAGFGRVVGTTQGRPVAGLRNFGGFTDGDRCVFMASALRARSIVLLGMDFGRIGAASRTRAGDRRTKAKKLRRARALLEWAAPRMARRSRLYTASGAVAGFARVGAAGLGGVLGG